MFVCHRTTKGSLMALKWWVAWVWCSLLVSQTKQRLSLDSAYVATTMFVQCSPCGCHCWIAFAWISCFDYQICRACFFLSPMSVSFNSDSTLLIVRSDQSACCTWFATWSTMCWNSKQALVTVGTRKFFPEWRSLRQPETWELSAKLQSTQMSERLHQSVSEALWSCFWILDLAWILHTVALSHISWPPWNCCSFQGWERIRNVQHFLILFVCVDI